MATMIFMRPCETGVFTVDVAVKRAWMARVDLPLGVKTKLPRDDSPHCASSWRGPVTELALGLSGKVSGRASGTWRLSSILERDQSFVAVESGPGGGTVSRKPNLTPRCEGAHSTPSHTPQECCETARMLDWLTHSSNKLHQAPPGGNHDRKERLGGGKTNREKWSRTQEHGRGMQHRKSQRRRKSDVKKRKRKTEHEEDAAATPRKRPRGTRRTNALQRYHTRKQ